VPEPSLTLIAVDGLGELDLPHLLKLMPKTADLLKSFEGRKLNSRPFGGAQPIWAELLTGRPWFENGCAGYSRPGSSLNHLEVFSEDDLSAPVTLLSRVSDIVINIPLLKPIEKERVWLSDGSTSTNTMVSPVSLLNESLFGQYQARPYASAIEALPQLWTALDACLKTERVRLQCAMELFKSRPWKSFLLRISIFDHLAHLFGPNLYQQTKLRHFDLLRSFLTELDEALSILLKPSDDADFCLISCFSHVMGRGRVNLNNVLQYGKFTELVKPQPERNADQERREAAMRAILRKPDDSLSHLFRSGEGRLCASETQAASPISGCIFVNDKERFSDGIVQSVDFQSVKSKVSDHLAARIVGFFGNQATVCYKPENKTEAHATTPEFIVWIDGVEFYDVVDPRLSEFHVPRSVHSPDGFVFLPRAMKVDSSALTPVGLSEILRRNRE
jgi:hypothetical protein